MIPFFLATGCLRVLRWWDRKESTFLWALAWKWQTQVQYPLLHMVPLLLSEVNPEHRVRVSPKFFYMWPHFLKKKTNTKIKNYFPDFTIALLTANWNHLNLRLQSISKIIWLHTISTNILDNYRLIWKCIK